MPKNTKFHFVSLTAILAVVVALIGGFNSSVLAQDTGPCRLDKVGTFSEVGSAGPQRIEVGGGGGQHADLYPAKGVKAVSYIVPPTEPFIYMGFGSIWEGNGASCDNFNWVKDATGYAEDRVDNGHSGLVIDLRGDKPEIVANVQNLSDEEIADLLGQHMDAVVEGNFDFGDLSDNNSGGSGEEKATPVVNTDKCPEADDDTWDENDNSDKTVTGPAIVQPWWNNGAPSFGDEQVRVIVASGTEAVFNAAHGKVYAYDDTDACNANLASEFENGSSLKAVHLSDLEDEGLVTVNKTGDDQDDYEIES